MFFIILTFIAAFAIESLGTLVSVIGLSSMFGANPIIIALAIALDLGKIVTVSFLYTYWKRVGWTMKTYALLASLITMTITSSGAFGYLSGEFTKATVGVSASSAQVDILKKQQQGYQDRKKQIDDQIAALPTKTTVSQRLRLMNGFKTEEAALDKKISDIDDQLPKLQVDQVKTNSEAGPIVAISKIFNVPIETAVTYVICLIIPVFDPLAIFLIITGNFLWARRKADQEEEKRFAHVADLNEKLEKFNPEKHGGEVDFGPAVGKEFPNEEPVTEGIIDETAFNTSHSAIKQMMPLDPAQSTLPINVDGPPAFAGITEWMKANPGQDPFPRVNIDVPAAKTEEELEAIRAAAQKEAEQKFWAEQHEKAQANRIAFEEETQRKIDEAARLAEEPAHNGPTIVPNGTLDPVRPDPNILRPQITKSTLGLVQPDPATIVDTNRTSGFRRAQVITTPTKR